ncbi:selenocysteine-specific translation elongation factor [Corynebacterium otitidis]|uniref:Selenocysteine-specific elongation factor n=1 Tax=Corynebacterium otitidis ATCC 51513 TaxID=883169 RepID=I7LBQ2_9CORY|nr:selenocysteine-specific translation elongation factor [Corynebacterium otitidis]EJZ82074.1 selenocysteine-specific translation elongation factor [Corynebacterium otitidis ATCC 51513]CCI83284.1 selenocysteine-specific elongation factor [Corynebacterium otitidis ATCC 51513]
MQVVATAGHVDHGKSTLVKRLTGMEPDRWREEKERGLTIDLGFVWCELPSGRRVEFVDVPGHERFLSNALAGLGPARCVLLVVAADEGVMPQTRDHIAAIDALGIDAGVVALTRADRTDDTTRLVAAEEAADAIAGRSLAGAPIVPVSAVSGEGVDELAGALDGALGRVPAADPAARVRLFLDRSFSVSGAGTVVTGSLMAGTVRPGDRLVLHGRRGPREVRVRGVQRENADRKKVEAPSRVALNLRQIAAEDVGRGDVLATPGAWHDTDVLDVRRVTGDTPLDEAPRELACHIGTAELTVRLRSLGAEHARLHLPHPLPLQVTDRLVLRAPGGHEVLAGVEALDVDPPDLGRRGAGRRRAAWLEDTPLGGSVERLLDARGAVVPRALANQGYRLPDHPPEGARGLPGDEGTWWVTSARLEAWAEALASAAQARAEADPLDPMISARAAVDAAGLPDEGLLRAAASAAGLELSGGYLAAPGARAGLGPAEKPVAELERKLSDKPFAAPTAGELEDLGLGRKEIAAAVRAGRLIEPADGVVLLPTAPRDAALAVAGLGEFTLAQAKERLGTTRRVAVPLFEEADRAGYTRRVDGTLRVVTGKAAAETGGA